MPLQVAFWTRQSTTHVLPVCQSTHYCRDLQSKKRVFQGKWWWGGGTGGEQSSWQAKRQCIANGMQQMLHRQGACTFWVPTGGGLLQLTGCRWIVDVPLPVCFLSVAVNN